MKAIVQEGSGSADVLHVREVDKPVVTDGHVLVRVRAASVNALDWHSVHGGRMVEVASTLMRQPDQPIRGVDVSGNVEAVGAGVTQFAPGDEVFGGAPAAFAEYALARESSLVLKPQNMSFDQAAAVGVAGRTALQGLRRLRAGEAGATRLDLRRGRRRRNVRRADREGARSARHRGDEHEEP